MSNETLTTLICLFHEEGRASRAMNDLQRAGVPTGSIQSLKGAGPGSTPGGTVASLDALDLTAADRRALADGLAQGGTLIVVRADDQTANKVEEVFADYEADRITGQQSALGASATSGAATEGATIPILEETLVVGKRQVARGGVRVFARVVEVPVEETVTLREEHATLERHAVDRPISESELNSLRDQTVEVRNMAEEAVVGKTAHIVEEVRVHKEATERTEQIHDTVRKTQVDVDETAANESSATGQSAFRAGRS